MDKKIIVIALLCLLCSASVVLYYSQYSNLTEENNKNQELIKVCYSNLNEKQDLFNLSLEKFNKSSAERTEEKELIKKYFSLYYQWIDKGLEFRFFMSEALLIEEFDASDEEKFIKKYKNKLTQLQKDAGEFKKYIEENKECLEKQGINSKLDIKQIDIAVTIYDDLKNDI